MAVDVAIALTTLAEAKAFLKITASSEDTILSELINAASLFANTYCGRQFIQKTWTEYYDGTGRRELILRNYPIVTLTSVNDDPQYAWGPDTAIDVANLAVDKNGAILRIINTPFSFNRAPACVKVVYDAGFATSAIPYDLKEAVHFLISSWYKNAYEFQRLGLQTITQGDRTLQTRDEDVPKSVKSILDAYRFFGAETTFAYAG